MYFNTFFNILWVLRCCSKSYFNLTWDQQNMSCKQDCIITSQSYWSVNHNLYLLNYDMYKGTRLTSMCKLPRPPRPTLQLQKCVRKPLRYLTLSDVSIWTYLGLRIVDNLHGLFIFDLQPNNIEVNSRWKKKVNQFCDWYSWLLLSFLLHN